MKTKQIALFLALVASFSFAFNTQAAETSDTRYFVKSTASFWKKSFSVRNNFDNGFTADLTDWQLRFAKILGVEVEPVKKLNILDTTSAVKKPSRALPSQNIPWGIQAVYDDASVQKTSGGDGVNVAVLDTGIYNHVDLKSKISQCKDFSSAKPIVDGKCDDKNGHGTHVAGIIAANGGSDGKGIMGVAPEANIFAYKVCSNSGSCWADDIAAAIKTAADNGANIINLSLGSDSSSPLIEEAVSYATSKNVLIVAAGGNDGPDSGTIDYPAASPKVVSVAAVDSGKQISDWSARGNNSTSTPYVREEKDMEFAAPGVEIESTWKDGGYMILSGTSMAAPHISGLAAKEWQKDAANPAEATLDILHKLSQDILPIGDDNASGWGMPQL